MRVGVISDTHIPSMGDEPPPEVAQAFEGVDVILHAGDVYVQSCIDWLEQIAPVHAAMSIQSSAAEGAPRASAPVVVTLEGRTIGMVHQLFLIPLAEDVYPGMIAREYPADRSIASELADVFGQPVDIVVFGYTHEALIETHEGVLFLNPGSPNMVKQIMKTGSVAILELTPETAEARIVDLASLEG